MYYFFLINFMHQSCQAKYKRLLHFLLSANKWGCLLVPPPVGYSNQCNIERVHGRSPDSGHRTRVHRWWLGSWARTLGRRLWSNGRCSSRTRRLSWMRPQHLWPRFLEHSGRRIRCCFRQARSWNSMTIGLGHGHSNPCRSHMDTECCSHHSSPLMRHLSLQYGKNLHTKNNLRCHFNLCTHYHMQ